MTVDIKALGPNGHRDYKHLYREGLDAAAMRTLVEAMTPLLPEYSTFVPADEDEWLFYGVSVYELHPDLYNAVLTTLRATGSAEVKAAIAKLGDAVLTELGTQSQLIRLDASPWTDSSGKRQFQVTASTDGNALDEPKRNACLSNAKALYREYGLSEPNGRDCHLLLASDVLKAAEGRDWNDLAKIASWAVTTFGPPGHGVLPLNPTSELRRTNHHAHC